MIMHMPHRHINLHVALKSQLIVYITLNTKTQNIWVVNSQQYSNYTKLEKVKSALSALNTCSVYRLINVMATDVAHSCILRTRAVQSTDAGRFIFMQFVLCWIESGPFGSLRRCNGLIQGGYYSNKKQGLAVFFSVDFSMTLVNFLNCIINLLADRMRQNLSIHDLPSHSDTPLMSRTVNLDWLKEVLKPLKTIIFAFLRTLTVRVLRGVSEWPGKSSKSFHGQLFPTCTYIVLSMLWFCCSMIFLRHL